jgi:hypothetical protein
VIGYECQSLEELEILEEEIHGFYAGVGRSPCKA